MAWWQSGASVGFCRAWSARRTRSSCLFSGRKIDAQEAELLGVVNRVLPHDELLGFVNDYVRELATHWSPASMAAMKRQDYNDLSQPLGRAEKEASRLMLESFGLPDFREGVVSFMEKRSPRFKRV